MKWVWFDLDDTLHDFSTVSRSATAHILDILSQKSGLPADIAESHYRDALKIHNQKAFADGRTSHEYRYERFRASIKTSALSQELLHSIVEAAVAEYERLFMDGLQLKIHAAETLQTLKDKGYSLAILSDAPHDAQTRVLERLQIHTYFEHIFTSGGLGLSKQDGMMDVVLKKISAQPGSVTMVGDSLERDIKPALRAGVSAIWFNEKRLPKDTACGEIFSLHDLLGTMA